MAAFQTPLDIYNRALQRLGQPRVVSYTASPKSVGELNALYDKLRETELMRNLWRFATKRVVLRAIGIDTVLWTPTAWVSGSNYAAGMVVSYTPTSGPYQGVTDYWQLSVAETSSTTTPDADPNWDHYAGPLAIDLYNTGMQGSDSTSANMDGVEYQAGEVVLVPATWSSEGNYAINNVVAYENDGVWQWYVNLTGDNTGNPVSDTTDWALWTSDGRADNFYGVTTTGSPIPLTYPGAFSVYISLYNSNADNPLAAAGNWLSLSGTVTPLTFVWPIGTGPAHDLSTMNCFHLPNDWLKQAPTDPKGGIQSWLGARSGSLPENDIFESRFIVSMDGGPIMRRFVANITDVTKMNAMFCEGLGARCAEELCETLTQDEQRKQLATAAYEKTIRNARTANAIEIGPITLPENKYVTVRV